MSSASVLSMSHTFIRTGAGLRKRCSLIGVPRAHRHQQVVKSCVVSMCSIVGRHHCPSAVSCRGDSFSARNVVVSPLFVLGPPRGHRGVCSTSIPLHYLLPGKLRNVLAANLKTDTRQSIVPIVHVRPYLRGRKCTINCLSTLYIGRGGSPHGVSVGGIRHRLIRVKGLPRQILASGRFGNFDGSRVGGTVTDIASGCGKLRVLLASPRHYVRLTDGRVTKTAVPRREIVLTDVLYVLKRKGRTPMLTRTVQRCGG